MKATSVLILLSTLVAVVGKKKQEALNRDTTPFWLRDRLDGELSKQPIFVSCPPRCYGGGIPTYSDSSCSSASFKAFGSSLGTIYVEQLPGYSLSDICKPLAGR